MVLCKIFVQTLQFITLKGTFKEASKPVAIYGFLSCSNPMI